MELSTIPIRTLTPTGDILYRGDETFTLAAGRKLIIRDKEGDSVVDRFEEKVPAGKQWSVRILLEITETGA
jgi:hypothetical protein